MLAEYGPDGKIIGYWDYLGIKITCASELEKYLKNEGMITVMCTQSLIIVFVFLPVAIGVSNFN